MKPRLVRSVAIAAVVTLGTLLSACDSTNRINASDVDTGPSTVQDGSPSPTASATAVSTASPGAKPSGGKPTPGKPGAPVSPGTSSTPGTPTAPASTLKPTVASRMGPGVDATSVVIGVDLFKVGGYGKAVGLGSLSFGDTQAQANAVIAYVNSHGGLAGRKIKPVFYTTDFGRTNGHDGQFEEESCAKWTQDNRVFAAVSYTMSRLSLLYCLAKKQIPGIYQGMPIDEQTLAKYKTWYFSTSGGPALTLDRQASVTTKALGQMGWFGENAVVGVEYYDDPAYKRIFDTVFTPLFKSFGAKTVIGQGAPRGGTNAAGYVTKFKAAGVTHVFFLGEAGAYPQYFMQAAQNQQYFPKYALNSNMTAGVTLQRTVSKQQLVNATGVGWQPTSDVDGEHDPGSVGPAQDLCLSIMRSAGQDMGNRGARLTALTYCNSFFLLQQAMTGLIDLTGEGLSHAVEGIGDRFKSPTIFGTHLSAERHDGANKYRIFTFAPDRARYTSPLRTMP